MYRGSGGVVAVLGPGLFGPEGPILGEHPLKALVPAPSRATYPLPVVVPGLPAVKVQSLWTVPSSFSPQVVNEQNPSTAQHRPWH